MDHTQDEILLMLGEVRADVKALLTGKHDHDTRLQKVERNQWWVAGGSAVISLLAVKIGLPFLPH